MNHRRAVSIESRRLVVVIQNEVAHILREFAKLARGSEAHLQSAATAKYKCKIRSVKKRSGSA
jgi:hypothetical protein